MLVPYEKLLVLIFDAQFFSKHNETYFIPDQYCDLADDGSPLFDFLARVKKKSILSLMGLK